MKLLLGFLLALMCACGCEQKETVGDDGSEKATHSILFFSTETPRVQLGENTSVSLECAITPSGFEFEDGLGPELFTLRIVASSYTGLIGSEPESYGITDVVPLLNSDGEEVAGQYVVTISDLGISADYNDRVVLEVSGTGADGKDAFAVSEPIDVFYSGNSIYFFAFRRQDNPTAVLKDVTVPVDATEAHVETPYLSSPSLAAYFETDAETVLVDGVEQESGTTVNDFSRPVEYSFVSSDGDVKKFKVSVTWSGLPVVIIETPGHAAIPPKTEDWLEGTQLTILKADGQTDYKGTVDIRGRGNTTWNYPKKPYAIKLPAKEKILDMPKHKRWVLLANWMDRTLLRNRVSFKIATMTGLAWTPRGEFVDVILNGTHVGNYYLCEQIKVDENRVNVGDGNLMELDTYYDETYKFRSPRRDLPYMFKDPDDPDAARRRQIEDYVAALENSLYDDAQFRSRRFVDYLDLESFADYWLVHELTHNDEPGWPKSTYMHKTPDGKMTAGPVWDFDWGTFNAVENYAIWHAVYFGRLLEDAGFRALVKTRWNQFKPGFEEVAAFIESEAERIKSSEKMNHRKWPINQDVNADERLSFTEAVAKMKDNYVRRVQWLDKEINKF